MELKEALEIEDLKIDKITLLTKVYDTGQIPTDISKSRFIALPKKPGATEYGLHRMISFRNHINKIFLILNHHRKQNTNRKLTEDEQCGFVEGKVKQVPSTHQTIIDQAVEVQKEASLTTPRCFTIITQLT